MAGFVAGADPIGARATRSFDHRSGEILAIDASTGAMRWRVTAIKGGLATVFRPARVGSIVLAGFTVFSAPNRSGVVAVDATTGQERWRYSAQGTAFAGGPAILEESVFVTDTSGRVIRLEANTGRVLRRSRSGLDDQTQDHRALGVCGKVLVATSLTGRLVGLSVETLEPLWQYGGREIGSAGFSIQCRPDASFVPYMNGIVVARPIDGKARQLNGVGRGNPDAPLVSGRDVYVIGQTGFDAYRLGDF